MLRETVCVRVFTGNREVRVHNEKVSKMLLAFLCSALAAGSKPKDCIYGRKMEGEAEKAERGGVRRKRERL